MTARCIPKMSMYLSPRSLGRFVAILQPCCGHFVCGDQKTTWCDPCPARSPHMSVGSVRIPVGACICHMDAGPHQQADGSACPGDSPPFRHIFVGPCSGHSRCGRGAPACTRCWVPPTEPLGRRSLRGYHSGGSSTALAPLCALRLVGPVPRATMNLQADGRSRLTSVEHAGWVAMSCGMGKGVPRHRRRRVQRAGREWAVQHIGATLSQKAHKWSSSAPIASGDHNGR